MNNKQQSAETKNEQCAEAQVKTLSHSNGNTYVICCQMGYLILIFILIVSCSNKKVIVNEKIILKDSIFSILDTCQRLPANTIIINGEKYILISDTGDNH